jgi:hypothetical protein
MFSSLLASFGPEENPVFYGIYTRFCPDLLAIFRKNLEFLDFFKCDYEKAFSPSERIVFIRIAGM